MDHLNVWLVRCDTRCHRYQEEVSMNSTFLSPRRLRWQLSLSYVVVVVVAMLALLMGGLVMLLLSPSLTPSEQLVQLLEMHPVVQSAAYIVQNRQEDTLSQQIQVPLLHGLNVSEVLGLTIVNSADKPYTIYDMQHITTVKRQYWDVWMRVEAQGIVRSAFANDQQRDHLVYTFTDGTTVAAVPLLNNRGSPVGVFFIAARGLSRSDSLPSNPLADWLTSVLHRNQAGGAPVDEAVTVKDILPFVLLLILVISLVGVVFGVLVAGRLTRRLKRIMTAVHAWSQGRLETTIQDASPDELGQLVQDLNNMALQVQTLLQTRQELTLLEERQRVARDLHDSVKQHTFAITLLIGAAQTRLPGDPEAAQTYLGKAGDLADRTRQELSAILQQMRPPPLAEKGLKNALQDCVFQWSHQTGIAAEYSAVSVQSLPLDVEEALLRVAQEALANVARHSHATRVNVQVEQEPERISLIVRDNGKGFNVECLKNREECYVEDRVDRVSGKYGKGVKVERCETGVEYGGQGLTNMRERAEMLGGSLEIASDEAGTCITVSIPLVPQAPLATFSRQNLQATGNASGREGRV